MNPLVSPINHLDTRCAYCGDGEPVIRVRHKSTCEKCVEAFAEAGMLERRRGETLHAVVRRALGKGPRDYPAENWERVIAARLEAARKENGE